MKPNKIFLIFLSLVAIGFLVLPSTVSLLAGQHYWYGLNDTGNDVPCEKCHADIAEEMKQIHGPHTDETGYGRFECEYCHRIFPIDDQNSTRYNDYTYASGDGSGASPGDEAHAASTVACMQCHSGGSEVDLAFGDPYYRAYDRKVAHDDLGNDCTRCHSNDTTKAHDDPSIFSDSDCWRCHSYTETDYDVYYVPPAGGFGLTAYPYENGSMAAHKSFVMDSNDSDVMEDVNEACIACHTGIAVKINFRHARSLEFDAIADFSSYEDEATEHDWVVNNWQVNGTANVTVYGNTTGEWAGTYYPDDSSVWQGHVPGVNYTYDNEN